jgi:hypothetical protein
MTGRRSAIALALLVLLVALATVLVEQARGDDHRSTDRGSLIECRCNVDPVLDVIRREFGTGPLAGCFAGIAWRESRYNPRATNWHDLHADGSRGSFGLFQIGALNRRPGESVAAFARRMYDPAANAALAHELYRRFGLAPWGGRC